MIEQIKNNRKRVLAGLLCLLFVVLSFVEIRWHIYYKNMWEPLIEVMHNKGAVNGMVYVGETTFYMKPPSNLTYGSNIGISKNRPYDDSVKEPQYFADILVFPLKDGSYQYRVYIDQILAMNSYDTVCVADIDPDTLEVYSDFTTEEEKSVLKKNESIVRESIAEMRNFFSPYLD